MARCIKVQKKVAKRNKTIGKRAPETFLDDLNNRVVDNSFGSSQMRTYEEGRRSLDITGQSRPPAHKEEISKINEQIAAKQREFEEIK